MKNFKIHIIIGVCIVFFIIVGIVSIGLYVMIENEKTNDDTIEIIEIFDNCFDDVKSTLTPQKPVEVVKDETQKIVELKDHIFKPKYDNEI